MASTAPTQNATSTWNIDAAHSAIEFAAKHMMITTVKGRLADAKGTITIDEANPDRSSVAVEFDAASLDTRSADRDQHLRSADFLDVEQHPAISFKSRRVEGARSEEGKSFKVIGDLTIRGVTRPAVLDVHYLGQWQTPWWEDGMDKGPKTRAGFVAKTSINRQDFGVNWNDTMDRGGIVVSNIVEITIDAEAILEDE